jgi:transposase
MGVKRCKLAKKTPRKLLEFFVLEVPARAAADLLGLQANTTTLFYRKVRGRIAEKLEAAASEVAGEIE